MKAMIFAAGLGTRLRPLTDDRPKALVTVNGKTLLEHCICYLQSFGIQDVVVNVHHFASDIIRVLSENKGFGSTYQISDESNEVLETGGGLKKAGPLFGGSKDILLMNVDIMTNLRLDNLINAHHDHNALITLAVMQRNSSRHLLFDQDNRLMGWENSQTGQQKISRTCDTIKLLAFSGISLLKHEVLDDIPFSGKFSLIDLYLYLAQKPVILGYDHTGDVLIDVGKPENLQKAATLFK